MLRSYAVKRIAILTTVSAIWLTSLPCEPENSHACAAEVANLKDQLEKGLRATRPEEIEFIDQIVKLVDNDQLPLRIVNAAFSWARRRRPSYPFPYFERAVRILASREGIKF